MATKPLTYAAIQKIKRQYPHVPQIGDDPTQKSVRLAWDRIHDLTEQLTAATATIKTLVGAVNTTNAGLATAQGQAASALAISQTIGLGGTTNAGGGTGGSGTAPGGDGAPPGTGTPPPGGGGGTTTSNPGASPSQVTIDGYNVIINGGSPDVSKWAKTTQITAFDSSVVFPTFGKQTDPGSWPDVVPPGFGGPLQYTLWVFEQRGGQWYASGIIQFWRGRTSGGANIACNTEMARNWTYDSRWGAMAGYQPQPGELVGFMVTAGNQRGQDDHLVAERSNIVFISFPACGGTTSFPPFVSQT